MKVSGLPPSREALDVARTFPPPLHNLAERKILRKHFKRDIEIKKGIL